MEQEKTIIERETAQQENVDQENVTMSKADYEKAIQSASDKVRGQYAEQVKALKAKVAELTPPVKTQAEIALEKRLAALELKEREAEAKSKRLDLLAALGEKKLDAALADHLKDGADVEALATVIDNLVNERMKGNGYVPTGHQNNTGTTREDWKNMDYAQREALFNANPALAQSFMGNR
ncbi:MAG: hypothetical protein VB115_14355 [Christensenellaceae bacterium]|nr:hypothetical protein [Christensenellaceae bacterium]